MSITIDQKGAQTIGDMLITGHPQVVDQICNAFLAAAAGDFAPLAELVGTREVEGVPAPVCEFREGDIIVSGELGEGWAVASVHYETPAGWLLRVTRGDSSYDLRASLCVLTHRRHFRAGERPSVVAVGQCRSGEEWERAYTVGYVNEQLGFCSDAERSMTWSFEIADFVKVPLFKDWSAPEAVEVKP